MKSVAFMIVIDFKRWEDFVPFAFMAVRFAFVSADTNAIIPADTNVIRRILRYPHQ